MGSNSNTIWYAIAIWVMILNSSFYSAFSVINKTHISPNSLDDYLYNYSSKSIAKKPHTGVVYNISLPDKFSGMKVSILRLRSSTLWAKGANFSSISIPSRIITMPYVKRLAIMYENLGNLSSNYYELPGYTILTPIIGFVIYDAMDLSGKTSPKKLNITLVGEPIRVKFGQVQVLRGGNMKLNKCVRFDTSDIVELSNMVRPNVCSSQALGHFAIATPRVSGSVLLSPSPSPLSSLSRDQIRTVGLWKWWMVGFAGGLFGLILVISISVLGFKAFGSRKIKRMERKAEKSEFLDTRWIGNSKMPSATMTRTHAATLEIDFSP